MIKPLLWFAAYIGLAVAGMISTHVWLSHRSVAQQIEARAVLAYPPVGTPAGLDALTYRSAHLDGWKRAVEHAKNHELLSDDQLSGFQVGDPARDRGFNTGYSALREAFLHLVADSGGDRARIELIRLTRLQPRLYDIRIVAPPP